MATQGGKCIICSHFNYHDAAVQVFGFPSNKTKMDQWRKAVSGNYSFLSPSKRSFLCALHFEPECLSENGELVEDAQPSVWLEYSDDDSFKARKKSRKGSASKRLSSENAEGSDKEDTKEETVMIVPDIMLPDDFEPHENEDGILEPKKNSKKRDTPLKKGKRKSAVLVVPKDHHVSHQMEFVELPDNPSTPKDGSTEEDELEDKEEVAKQSAKRPRTVKVKGAELAEKKIPKPFEIYVSEPTSKTKYTAECITCEKHMFDSTQIVMHIKDEHLQAQGSFQCRVCMEKFAFLFACQNHLVLHLDGQLV